ncbi:MAG: DUF488 domain-containing protein [Patescibacteria group bacterium]|nr:DUF488 domain-containing protein [Patescibacteria group bacterium]
MLQIKRVYDDPAKADGIRVLVDRLWPRGMTKERAATDLWLKEVAPSSGLRTWFNHNPERFEEFSLKYSEELTKNSATTQLEDLVAKNPTVTLLYAAKDTRINNATVLRNFLEKSSRP